jgi:hypothetical protein
MKRDRLPVGTPLGEVPQQVRDKLGAVSRRSGDKPPLIDLLNILIHDRFWSIL